MPILLLAIDDSEFSRAAVDEIVEHMRPDAVTVHVLTVIELDRMVPPALDFARGTAYGRDLAAHVHEGHDAAEQLARHASCSVHIVRIPKSVHTDVG